MKGFFLMKYIKFGEFQDLKQFNQQSQSLKSLPKKIF